MPPRDFRLGNFWQLIGKNKERKKGKKLENVEENEEKSKKRRKLKENEKYKGKKAEDLFFFLLFTFRKHGNVYREKAKITPGKIGKSDFPPLKIFPVTPQLVDTLQY